MLLMSMHLLHSRHGWKGRNSILPMALRRVVGWWVSMACVKRGWGMRCFSVDGNTCCCWGSLNCRLQMRSKLAAVAACCGWLFDLFDSFGLFAFGPCNWLLRSLHRLHWDPRVRQGSCKPSQHQLCSVPDAVIKGQQTAYHLEELQRSLLRYDL